MSFYYGKVLELVAIESDEEKASLRVKILAEEEFQLVWEIDSSTASNLQEIVQFDEKAKYRLSLHTKFDLEQEQYISSITRTYLDKSEQLHFTCSLDYKNNLESLKTISNIYDLHKIPCFSVDLPTSETSEVKKKQEKNVEKASLKYALLFKSRNIAIIVSMIFLGSFIFSNHPFFNKSILDNAPIATTQVEAAYANLDLSKEKSIDFSFGKLEDNDSIEQSFFPDIEIKDFITYSISKDSVALTFDDGPSKYTDKIIDILKKYEVGGTFFFVGSNVKKYPDQVRYAQQNGYAIGNHTMNHPRLTKYSYEKQEKEIVQAAKVLEDITKEKARLFRPPYSSSNEETKKILNSKEYKMVLWNMDPKDWQTRDADKIFEHIRKQNTSGSIILLHESQSVIDALPRIIEHLQEQNLKIVSLK